MTLKERTQAASPTTPEAIAAVPAFADLSADDLAWLAAHMREVSLPAGEIVLRKGEPADFMTVVLEGEIRSDIEGGRSFTVEAGRVTGMLPFSRMESFPATARTTRPTRAVALHKELFPEMLQRIPQLQPRLIAILNDRVREATRSFEQREKLTALGKLSAGLAHELNNPAAAARRAAENLRQALLSVRAASLALDKGGLPQDSRIYLAHLEFNWDKTSGPQRALDSLERSDREEELAGWLEQKDIEDAWDLAPALVDLGCTKEILEDIARHVEQRFLKDVLTRTTAAFTIGRLAEQIASATGRISEMVRAVKEYSYMDQAPEQCIDIHDGIENTLIMLQHDLKVGVQVVREYDRSIPKVVARGSELNQIWTNLIVNAADAMQRKGKLIIRTMRESNCARVEVIDDGPGVPDEIKSHIFDPFFTTKPVGEGTGLGLDVVQRIARSHDGDVSFESRPGETRFIVRIPFSKSSGGRN